MQWLRRNENRANLTNQNIKFQFNNEILNSLSKTLIPVGFFLMMVHQKIKI